MMLLRMARQETIIPHLHDDRAGNLAELPNKLHEIIVSVLSRKVLDKDIVEDLAGGGSVLAGLEGPDVDNLLLDHHAVDLGEQSSTQCGRHGRPKPHPMQYANHASK